MKHKLHLSVLIVFFVSLFFFSRAEAQSPLGTGFTYQGYLAIDGVPVGGNCDFQFSLWDALSSGAQVGSTVSKDSVLVTDGVFSVMLDFGAEFDGETRWLEAAVRCPAGSGSYTTLSPRQELSAAPYALYSLNTDMLDGQEASEFALSGHTHPASGWNLTGNAGTTPGTNYIGTSDNQALEIKVNGQRVMRVEPNAISPNILGGYSGNWLTSGVYGAVIAGGGTTGFENRITDVFNTIGGGVGNQAGNNAGAIDDRVYITIGGGKDNIGSEDYSTIGGGTANVASGYVSTIAGGNTNVASGSTATVSGGSFNTASGSYGIIAGGFNNTAVGNYSYAAGRRGKANHLGAFVWADSNDADFASTANNQFNVRAYGGVRFVTNNTGATIDGNTIWHGGNDGAGSTLDADLLDGQHANELNYWSKSGNAGTSTGTNYIGTSDNQALEIKVNGLRVMRFEPNATSPNIMSGYSGNAITTGVIGAAICGGGKDTEINMVTDDYGTISGGKDNQAGDNTGTTSDKHNATVSGGNSNIASGGYSTISGGGWNEASGGFSTVAGGYGNTAAGDWSFAAGTYAKANSTGCFVWADSNTAGGGILPCDYVNRWVARTTGGVYFYTNAALSAGSYLAAGSGTWASVSDRAVKENLIEVKPAEVLEKVASIPLSTWNYISEDSAIRHMGPMAQDFYIAFQLGDSEKAIGTIDADGVALASIQALYAENQALKARIEKLEAGEGGGAAKVSRIWNVLTIAACVAVSLIVSRKRK
jgi:hypothetical protein